MVALPRLVVGYLTWVTQLLCRFAHAIGSAFPFADAKECMGSCDICQFKRWSFQVSQTSERASERVRVCVRARACVRACVSAARACDATGNTQGVHLSSGKRTARMAQALEEMSSRAASDISAVG